MRKLFEEINLESPRAAVMVVASEIDLLLVEILELFFVPPSKVSLKYGKSIFATDQFGITFSTRIEIAFRAGLIPEWCQSDTHVIRRIRNEFAHKGSGYSFASSPVRELLSLLTVPVKLKDNNPSTLSEELLNNPKDVFILGAICVYAELLCIRENLISGSYKAIRLSSRRLTFKNNK